MVDSYVDLESWNVGSVPGTNVYDQIKVVLDAVGAEEHFHPHLTARHEDISDGSFPSEHRNHQIHSPHFRGHHASVIDMSGL